MKENRTDSRAMYEIQAYLVHTSSPSSVVATSLIDQYDRAIYSNDDKRALEIVNRMAGLLEGVYQSLNQLEEDNSIKITREAPPEAPIFTLTRDEKNRVLTLASEMRACVISAECFDFAHKNRLIKRITAIELEANKPKGLFDVILGGLSDTGEALGKFGNDVKPLVDRMTEIARITRSKSEEYEGLPAPEELKRLPPPES